MTPQIILLLLLAVLVFDYLFSQWLELINLRYQPDKLPKEVADVYDEADYQKAKGYHRERTRFGMVTATVSVIIWILALSTGFLGSIDSWVSSWVTFSWLKSLLVLGVIAFGFELLTLPFSLYSTFGLEERFGFNKTTPALFIVDKLKSWILTIIIGGILLGLFFYLANALGQSFWLIFWVIISAVIIFINMFYSSLILPLFNKLTPLEDSHLKTAIATYTNQEGFELENTYIMDGSKRSNKVNAFFSGLGKEKKVVLFDTMLDKLSEDEIVAVVAHEVGHNKRGHIPKFMLISVVSTGVMLFLLSLFLFSPALSQALGAEGLAMHLNLLAFFLFFSPLNHLIGTLTNILSRRFEFEADAFASETSSPSAMIGALKRLSTANLSNLTPHPLYAHIYYSHPPVSERIRAILAS